MDYKSVKLGELCELVTKGTTPTTLGHSFTSSGISFVKVESITEDGRIDSSKLAFISPATHEVLRRSQLKVNDVLFTIAGTIGRVGKVTESFLPANTNQAVALLRPNPEEIDADFLLYALKKQVNEGKVASGVVQAVQANFSLGNIRDLQLTLPASVTDQQKVVRILCSLDAKIDLNRRINQTLEAMAQAIFNSWFVDFDPVKAKVAARQEGRDPLRAAMNAISGKPDAELDTLPREQYDQLAGTAALFPDEMEESELGDIPRGWATGSLADFASFQNGYAFKTKDWTDSGHPVVKIGNVKPGIIDLSGCSFVSHETVGGLERFSLKRGDLLVGMTGYVGETGLVPALESVAYLNQRVGRISTPNGINDIGYPFCLVRDPAYKAYAESKAHGSAQANVSGKDLMDYAAVVPNTQVLNNFNAQVAKIIRALLCYFEESQCLAALRVTLLPKLLSGEVSVAGAMAETGA